MVLNRSTRLLFLCTAMILPLCVAISFTASWMGAERTHRTFWVGYELFDYQWDFQVNVPAGVSALYLWCAGAVWVVLSSQRRLGQPTWPMTFGAFLIFMGFDEVLMLHERLEALLQVDWQLLYLPVMGFGGLAWLAVMLRLRDDLKPARRALSMGAALWVISQILEFLQWKGAVKQPGYTAYVVAEEILESWGTLGFLLAAIIVGRLTARPSGSLPR